MSSPLPPPIITFGSRVLKSPFFEATRRWGCRAFSIYNHTFMPTHYGDPVAEYWHLLQAVTLWDVSCERQVQVTGPDAGRFVQWLTPRNLSRLAVGQAKYLPIVDENGGMINDPLLLRVEPEKYWLSLADSDLLLWAKGVALGRDFKVSIEEPDVSPLQVQGPRAPAVMEALCGSWIRELKYFWLRPTSIDGIPVVISRTGWSNELGYEIFLCDGSRGDELWEKIMSVGQPFDIQPACPNSIKRIEAGLLSYRNDMTLANNPFELGMDRFVDLQQPADFIGKAALQRIAAEGVKQKLIGLVLDGPPLASNENHWPVRLDDRPIGTLTSLVYSPGLEKNIGYAMLATAQTEIGQEVLVDTPEGERIATVTEMPFVANRAAGAAF